MKACCTSPHVAIGWVASYLANQLTNLPLRKIAKYYSLWSFVYFPLVTYTLVSCQICIMKSSLSWYFNSWMHKTIASMTTMSGFTFTIVAIVDGCGVDKVIVLTKSRFEVVPNSYLSNGWSLLPLFLKVFTGFFVNLPSWYSRPPFFCHPIDCSKCIDNLLLCIQ